MLNVKIHISLAWLWQNNPLKKDDSTPTTQSEPILKKKQTRNSIVFNISSAASFTFRKNGGTATAREKEIGLTVFAQTF